MKKKKKTGFVGIRLDNSYILKSNRFLSTPQSQYTYILIIRTQRWRKKKTQKEKETSFSSSPNRKMMRTDRINNAHELPKWNSSTVRHIRVRQKKNDASTQIRTLSSKLILLSALRIDTCTYWKFDLFVTDASRFIKVLYVPCIPR